MVIGCKLILNNSQIFFIHNKYQQINILFFFSFYKDKINSLILITKLKTQKIINYFQLNFLLERLSKNY